MLRAPARGDGTEFQVMLSQGKLGKESLAEWKRLVDIGDHVGVTGEVVASRRGELSVMADEWTVTSKALRPLPVAHKPLAEETRVRQRYVDLIVRSEARDNARNRAAVIRSLRDQLHGQDFIEVETPMMQVQPGGATARPFVTHMNAYDMDLYLRIAPELYLKRCVVGGIDRVFEINRNFRNEGADSSHSPEFAMLEAYRTYGDYRTIAELTKSLVQGAAESVFGSTAVTLADGSAYDLGGEWAETTLFGSLSEALGEEVTVDTPWTRSAPMPTKSIWASTRSGAPGNSPRNCSSTSWSTSSTRPRSSSTTPRRPARSLAVTAPLPD
ncbi:hypothetical protein GCM10029992_19170 [Glycomyces albus]